MFHRYDIHIKLRMEKSFTKKEIEGLLEYFMGVGDGVEKEYYSSFFKARKMLSIGISEQHKNQGSFFQIFTIPFMIGIISVTEAIILPIILTTFINHIFPPVLMPFSPELNRHVIIESGHLFSLCLFIPWILLFRCERLPLLNPVFESVPPVHLCRCTRLNRYEVCTFALLTCYVIVHSLIKLTDNFKINVVCQCHFRICLPVSDGIMGLSK